MRRWREPVESSGWQLTTQKGSRGSRPCAIFRKRYRPAVGASLWRNTRSRTPLVVPLHGSRALMTTRAVGISSRQVGSGARPGMALTRRVSCVLSSWSSSSLLSCASSSRAASDTCAPRIFSTLTARPRKIVKLLRRQYVQKPTPSTLGGTLSAQEKFRDHGRDGCVSRGQGLPETNAGALDDVSCYDGGGRFFGVVINTSRFMKCRTMTGCILLARISKCFELSF